MSKKVLILGAGLVSQPIIDYLFEKTDHTLTVADIVKENAQKAINGNPRGRAENLDVQDETALRALITDSDLVVSLLPYVLHSLVAKHCLAANKSMVNASYVSEEMQAFDSEAREKGLLFLCEMGLDPGIDHMSAVKIIDEAQENGGKITEFLSVCGGLPAPDSNNNPFGYKFSWSPKGVLLAGNNPARYIENGVDKVISAEKLFHSTRAMEIAGKEFEAYPNRDSVPYKEIYGLDGIKLLMRGTLRYSGWHKLILALKALHLIEPLPVEAGVQSFAELIAKLNDLPQSSLRESVAAKLGVSMDAAEMEAFAWLGLFSEEQRTVEDTTVLDLVAEVMNEKMSYEDGERDMVVLQHQFTIEYADHIDKVTSTLIDYGSPDGDSSMARTVSSPLAIAVRLILNGEIELTGVQIPVHKCIYEPVLKELETLGIAFDEEHVRVEHNN